MIKVAKEDKSLFVERWDQHQVEILSEYDIYIFPVTDLTSALNAIDLIVKQGEGINAQPYFDSHFVSFYEIAQEYEKLGQNDNNFKPILPVPHNPDETEDINNKLTEHIFKLFNYSYVTLLYVLTGLYGWYQPESEETAYPHFSSALREIAFAPAMTMLIRSLGEVLVQLPIGHGSNEQGGSNGKDNDNQLVAAPNFYIPLKDDQKLGIDYNKSDWQSDKEYTDIGFYLKRFEGIQKRLEPFANNSEKDECGNPIPKKYCGETIPEDVSKQLQYIYQNVYRLTGNLRQVYQSGVYSKFKTISWLPKLIWLQIKRLRPSPTIVQPNT